MKTILLLAMLLVSMMSETMRVSAQVFNSGPSDSSLFSTVFNVPPDPNFGENEIIGGSTQLNLSEGGTIGRNLEVLSGSELNISGGTVDGFINSRAGSEVNISGGFVECCFFAWPDGLVNISGGTVDGLFAFDNSTVNISGGTLSIGMEVFDGSIVIISGGSVVSFSGRRGSTIKLFGTEFYIDGVALDTLMLGQTYVITDRDVTLSGLFVDGTEFSFELNSTYTSGHPAVLRSSTVTVTLVPEPSASMMILAISGIALQYRKKGIRSRSFHKTPDILH